LQATDVRKLEHLIPLWPVKDRLGVSMIDAAERGLDAYGWRPLSDELD
jgi:hypothetical protein